MTNDKKREQNRANARAYRERKKTQALKKLIDRGAQQETTPAPEQGAGLAGVVAGETPELSVDVKADATPPRTPSLRERLGFGARQAKPQPAVKRPVARKKSPNLIVTTMPTIAAGLIAAYARERLPQEYAPCAPSRAEVLAVLGPLFDIIGRRVEVAVEASQDAIDLANALICTMAYGVRAYITYVDIKKAKEAGKPYEQKQQPRAAAPEPRAYQGQSNGAYPNPDREYEPGSGSEQPGAASDGASDLTYDQQLRNSEAEAVANMFKRDRAGRVGLGLLR